MSRVKLSNPNQRVKSNPNQRVKSNPNQASEV